ncbi:MAG TPA: hypothetical protein VMD48_12905, partial [Solirubrobacteraceae bacterium]|nr:hypothetical protein [Solirubrobacteraceae bacterium]
APFRNTASCEIEPQGLIAENFVECTPGRGAALRGSAGHDPTVPVSHTTEPVSITDLFDIWNVPTTERLTVLLNELGIGVAGEGDDIQTILQRANPALQLANRAIELVNKQRTQLESILTQTVPIVRALADRSPDVQRFISSAASVSEVTAAHRGALAQDIERLPALLRAARPALGQLNTLATQGAPILSDLRAAAPGLRRVVDQLPPFSAAGVTALSSLAPALVRTSDALRQGRSDVSELGHFTDDAVPTGEALDQLLVNARQRGVAEYLMNFAYLGASLLSRYDGTTHLAPTFVVNDSNCGNYSTTAVPGCEALFRSRADSSGDGGPSRSARVRFNTRRGARRASRRVASTAPAAGRADSGALAGLPDGLVSPSRSGSSSPLTENLTQLLNYLLK